MTIAELIASADLPDDMPELKITIRRPGMAPLIVELPAGEPAVAIKLLFNRLTDYVQSTDESSVHRVPAAGGCRS